MIKHIYNQPHFGESWFSFPNLYSRLVELVNDDGHFVEIGSWKGKSSAYMAVEIANSGKQIKFDCVDTWEGSPEHKEYDCLSNLYDIFIENMKPVEKYYTPIRMKSVDAANLYQDESLDFVFIDACHEYECVCDDIKAWYPKVKKGFILAGHDYTPGWSGVVKAVNENIKEKIIATEGCWVINRLY